MKLNLSKSDILNRIKQVAETSTDAGLARFLGISPATLSNWKARGSIDYDLVFSKCEQVDFDWLLTGKGDMRRREDIQLAGIEVSNEFRLRTDTEVDIQRIPLYEIDATAGLVSLFADVNSRIPVSYLEIPDLPPCDGAVSVRGDSMYPLLKSGDIVLYKQLQDIDSIFWGDMYLLSIDLDGEEYITVKYIQKSEREGYVKLVSQNPHHADKDIEMSRIRAIALVKASIRMNSIR